ncbi:acetyl-CoA carboxylase biotin carboxyl carrier protein [Alkalibacterium olivapovliticus]|uniref:Biotin carboxyl carrier protein of acetyl-CoA carboxylase n=1 Tax=Alkalibacterium olivapovliticus TaxID=99907 RepID=A0A2T0VT28_9LACT|nr:acetyl-CoA carboxylase biotin carboxyl carrier protein [Alkalibacterium olivapovliticus]PRY73932.1 acetyl-CoA carboxylase biotin carboxyl carrier protein [Alkalibacterium olivapovliticus]
MNFEQLKELIDHIDSSSLYEFEMENEEVSLKMSKREQAVVSMNKEVTSHPQSFEPNKAAASPEIQEVQPASQVVEDEENLHELKAPIVGTGYLSSSPETPAFVSEGDKVTKGQTLCIIEAMKVMNEIKSDVDGEVSKIMIEDGQPVEFNQSLIKIKTS